MSDHAPNATTRLARSLDAHCAALSACRRCEFEDPAVVPILSPARDTRAMLVGQAPGKTEVGDRRAFAGRAGKTLFRWLEAAGVEEPEFREKVYIAAITRCYPGPSPSGRGDRVPSPRERALCGEWLDAELALIRPALIIPVGRLAVDRFLGTAPLDQVIGKVHEVEHAGGASRVIPLPHPSGASSWVNLRANRALLDRALELLAHELGALGVGRTTTRAAGSVRKSA
ncbi:MAG TPA: uracil-DNA glycosylase family protein [Gemmatimonadaceae bacterium]